MVESIAGMPSDRDWIRHGITAFSWAIPGEIRVFEPGDLDEGDGLGRRLKESGAARRIDAR